MAFKFYIDNQLTDQPVNDTGLMTTIKRDFNTNGMVITQDVQLVYNGNNNLNSGEVSGYTILKTAFDLGQCTDLTITIYSQTTPITTTLIYRGTIKVPSISFNKQFITASTAVQDDSYYSFINNNKSIEYNIQSITTKNRLAITPPQIYEVDCFDSVTGVFGSSIGDYFRGYRVVDVFTYLISAISDNKVGFYSFFLQNNPTLFIFDGFSLANPNTDPSVKVAYEKLYDEIKKARNISFYIDTNDPNLPVLRIEDSSSLFSGVELMTFDDILQMIEVIKTDNIYGTVKVGASDNVSGAFPTPPYTFNAGTSYVGWVPEVYTPLGQCNTSNELNLVNDFGITSNDVYEQLIGAVTSDLDKLFLIECENVDLILFTATAVKYNSWIGTPYYYYNKGLNNPAKLNINGSNFQTGLTNTLEIGGNGFKAGIGSETLIGSYDPVSAVFVGGVGALTQPILFTDETTGSNYDGGGNYDNTTGIYVAPLNGLYSFAVNMPTDVVNTVHCTPNAQLNTGIQITNSPILTVGQIPTPVIRGFRVDIGIAIYTDNTLTTLISLQNNTYRISSDQAGLAITVSDAINLTVGNAVISQVLVRAEAFAPAYFGNNGIFNDINILPGWSVSLYNCGVGAAIPAMYALIESTFSCNGSPDGGGVLIANDPLLYKNKEVQFNYNIGEADWASIKLNPIASFVFIKDQIIRSGWISEMKHNNWTGETQIKLITNNAITS